LPEAGLGADRHFGEVRLAAMSVLLPSGETSLRFHAISSLDVVPEPFIIRRFQNAPRVAVAIGRAKSDPEGV
jgi:hypothetical protein